MAAGRVADRRRRVRRQLARPGDANWSMPAPTSSNVAGQPPLPPGPMRRYSRFQAAQPRAGQVGAHGVHQRPVVARPPEAAVDHDRDRPRPAALGQVEVGDLARVGAVAVRARHPHRMAGRGRADLDHALGPAADATPGVVPVRRVVREPLRELRAAVPRALPDPARLHACAGRIRHQRLRRRQPGSGRRRRPPGRPGGPARDDRGVDALVGRRDGGALAGRQPGADPGAHRARRAHVRGLPAGLDRRSSPTSSPPAAGSPRLPPTGSPSTSASRPGRPSPASWPSAPTCSSSSATPPRRRCSA